MTPFPKFPALPPMWTSSGPVPSAPKGYVAKVASTKIVIETVKEIREDALQLLAAAEPELIRAFFSNRIKFTARNFYPRDWLNANCKGRFFIEHIAYGDEEDGDEEDWTIGFESDEDLVLFKMTFEGTDT